MESLNAKICQSCHQRAVAVKTSDGKGENFLCKDCSKGFFAGRKILLCTTCKEKVPKDFKYDLSFTQLEDSRKQIAYYRVFCSEECLSKQQSGEKISMPEDSEPLRSCKACGKEEERTTFAKILKGETKVDINSMMSGGIPDPKFIQKLMSQSMMPTCARCKKVFYCDRDCQAKDWKEHKQQCQAPSNPN